MMIVIFMFKYINELYLYVFYKTCSVITKLYEYKKNKQNCSIKQSFPFRILHIIIDPMHEPM